MRKFRIFVQDFMNSFRTILLGFLILILLGAFLLWLPVSSAEGVHTPFLNALFTSASATCVTGLVVYDTAAYWSVFGKIVILLLIQIGGLGVVTVALATLAVTGKRIGLLQRSTMQDAISAPQIGGIIHFMLFFVKGSLLVEGVGALALSPVFIRQYGFVQGICYSVFHSVSAFCNAGFDLMGIHGQFSSLTMYRTNTYVNVVIMALIIIGGLGFMTWRDVLSNRRNLRGLRLQSKIIIVTTLVLLAIPFAYFFLFEFSGYDMKERILYSAFQSVTPRTAGFNTFDYGKMSDNGLLITIILMLTGGAPGSTAGGMKVTTLAVLLMAANSYMHRRDDVNCFKRRLDLNSIRNALVLIVVYLQLMLLGAVILSHLEKLPILNTMFECASALGTVGLTTGITTGLTPVSRIILIGFMYFGRVGGFTLAYASVAGKKKSKTKYPEEKIAIG